MELGKEIDSLLSSIGKGIIAASSAILEVYRNSISVEKKADNSPLTLADRRSHEILKKTLSDCRIGEAGCIPVLSEEGRNIPYKERSAWDMFWLVDPLDGTKEFIKKNGEFTINIALIKGTAPVFGFIYVPVQDLLYFGGPGQGARRLDGLAENKGRFNMVKARVLSGSAAGITTEDAVTSAGTERGKTARPDTEKGKTAARTQGGRGTAPPLRIVASRSHRNPGTDAFIDRLRSAAGPSREVEIVSAGSALKFCRVIEGAADLYPRYAPCMEWDTAAGHALAAAAGCYVYDIVSKKELEYNKPQLVNNPFLMSRETLYKEYV